MQVRSAPLLVVVPPPVFYVLAFAAGLAIDSALPWRPDWMHAIRWAGWALVAAGVAVGPGSAALFALRHTTLKPAGRPVHLVSEGAFRLSRNPMYVGLTLIYVGLAIALGRPWPLVLVVVPIAIVALVVIPFEEARMREAFGQDYEAYCRRVRRWI
ncbi:MAG: methyltransferase family protein [Sphingomonadales bacterium]